MRWGFPRGIFALHPKKRKRKPKFSKRFNSLYWDFCFASGEGLKRRKLLVEQYWFQFPLLGFLLCIECITGGEQLAGVNGAFRVSIPFIGIFALHQSSNTKEQLSIPVKRFASPILKSACFNSLYWDFCFASALLSRTEVVSIPFIGIFALHRYGRI
jgi:hypothetical protein